MLAGSDKCLIVVVGRWLDAVWGEMPRQEMVERFGRLCRRFESES